MLEMLLATKQAAPAPSGVIGQVSFTTAGTFSWVVPDSVTSISAVVVGSGARGTIRRGGALRWIKTLTVTPGETLTVIVGAGGVNAGGTLVTTRILRGSTVLLEAQNGENGSSTPTDGVNIGGGLGGVGGPYGGGGAGGYSGNGGAGDVVTSSPGAGGAGGGGVTYTFNGNTFGTGGGGVGLLGEGVSGAAATLGGNTGPLVQQQGKGGSEGNNSNGPTGGDFGGAGGGYSIAGTGKGGVGGCRIIWGNNRFYPGTNTQDM